MSRSTLTRALGVFGVRKGSSRGRLPRSLAPLGHELSDGDELMRQLCKSNSQR